MQLKNSIRIHTCITRNSRNISAIVNCDSASARVSKKTVKELIPVQQILQTYMSQADRNIDLGGDAMHTDTEDPDIYDEMTGEPEPETFEEPEPETFEAPEPEPEPETFEAPVVNGLDNEFKTIQNVSVPPGDIEDDVLFGDAADERTKKVGYN